jgi:hypothetical protein
MTGMLVAPCILPETGFLQDSSGGPEESDRQLLHPGYAPLLSFVCFRPERYISDCGLWKRKESCCMIRVLIGDNDLDSLELVDDLIEIYFQEAAIVRALTKDAFFRKIEQAEKPFNLILFNVDLEDATGEHAVERLKNNHADLLDRLVVLTTGPLPDDSPFADWPVLIRPFSMDLFGEVVTRACVR